MCAHVNVHPPMSLTNIPAYVLGIHVRFNHYMKTGSSGVKGRVRSYSIYIENLKLVGIVQRVSSKETDSCGVKGRVRSRPSVGSLLCPRPTHPPPGFQQ